MAAQGSSHNAYVVYTWPAAWGLPSVCPNCVYAEACCRLTGASLAIERCEQPHASPTGSLPALELPSGGCVPSPTGPLLTASERAQSISDYLTSHDLLLTDSEAGPSVPMARSLALNELSHACTALAFTNAQSFARHTKRAYLRAVPWLARQPVARSLHQDALREVPPYRANAVLEHATSALTHLQNWLSWFAQHSGRYTTAHLALAAHVAFVMQAPVAESSSLQASLHSKHSHIAKYAQSAIEDIFSFQLPTPPPAEPSSKAPRYEPTNEFKRGRNRFIAACIASVAGYALLGGGLVDIEDAKDELEEEDDGDDE